MTNTIQCIIFVFILILIHMYIVTYSKATDKSNSNVATTIKLKRIAEGKGWYVKKTFHEPIVDSSGNSELKSLIDYTEKTHVDAVMIAEISHLGNSVDNAVDTIKLIHEKGIGLYIHQFNLLTLENGIENPSLTIMLQALTAGAQLERNYRLTKQREGIKHAQTKGVYVGRKVGSTTSAQSLLNKYQNVAELIEKGEHSIRKIAKLTNRSINTVRKVKALKASELLNQVETV